MKTSLTPENSTSRAARRRRSGVKCVLLAAGIVVLAAGTYAVVYLVADAIACSSRAENISKALQNISFSVHTKDKIAANAWNSNKNQAE